MAKIKTSDVFQSKEAPNQSQSVSYAMTSPDEFGRIEAERLGRMTKAGLSLATEVDRLKDEDSKIEVLDAINKAKVGLSQKTAEIYAYADPKDIPRLVEEATVKAFQPLKKNGNRYYMFNLNEAVRNEKTKNVDKAVLFAQSKLLEKYKQVIADGKENIANENVDDVQRFIVVDENGKTHYMSEAQRHQIGLSLTNMLGRQPTKEEIDEVQNATLNKKYTELANNDPMGSIETLMQINNYFKENNVLTADEQAKSDNFIKSVETNIRVKNSADLYLSKYVRNYTPFEITGYVSTLPPDIQEKTKEYLMKKYDDNKKVVSETRLKYFDDFAGLIDNDKNMTLVELESKPMFKYLSNVQQQKLRDRLLGLKTKGAEELYQQLRYKIFMGNVDDGIDIFHESLNWEQQVTLMKEYMDYMNNETDKTHHKWIMEIMESITGKYGINDLKFDTGMVNAGKDYLKNNPKATYEDLKKELETYGQEQHAKNYMTNGKIKNLDIYSDSEMVGAYENRGIDREYSNQEKLLKVVNSYFLYKPNQYTYDTVLNNNTEVIFFENSTKLNNDINKLLKGKSEFYSKEHKTFWNDAGFFSKQYVKNTDKFSRHLLLTYSKIIYKIKEQGLNDRAEINEINNITLDDILFTALNVSGNKINLTEQQADEFGVHFLGTKD